MALYILGLATLSYAKEYGANSADMIFAVQNKYYGTNK